MRWVGGNPHQFTLKNLLNRDGEDHVSEELEDEQEVISISGDMSITADEMQEGDEVNFIISQELKALKSSVFIQGAS